MIEQALKKQQVSLSKLFLSFLRLGITAFGGPTMVAYIREMSVKKYQWLNQEEFKNGVALCQSLPGATAMQVAGYIGLIKRGLPGATATFIGFGLPAFLFMVVLSWLYTLFANMKVVVSLFTGLQVIVVAIVANATYIFAKDTLKKYQDILIALASALALWYGISPFFVILGAALTGLVIYRIKKTEVQLNMVDKTNRYITVLLIPLAFSAAGIVFLFVINKRLFDLSVLMMKIDLFAFGGGFASLPLMLQEIVNVRGWLDNKTFMDGIALGQVTPGPIVITATFVGFITNGLSGATVATMSIFVPSFILLILGANIFNRLQQSVIFQQAIRGIFASFVGLLLFVTFKFAFAVSWNAIKVVIAACAISALLKKIDILYVVLAGAIISILLI